MSLLTRIFKKNNRKTLCLTQDQIVRFKCYMIEKYNADYMSYTSKMQRKNTIEFRMYFLKNKKITFSIRNGVVKILDDNTFKDFTNKELQKDWDRFVEYVQKDLAHTVIQQKEDEMNQSIENEQTKNI